MKRIKIDTVEELKKIIDYYIKYDLPLSLLEDVYSLDEKQKAFLQDRAWAFTGKTSSVPKCLEQMKLSEISDDYLEFPHNIEEKPPLKNKEITALFKRLEVIKMENPNRVDANIEYQEIRNEIVKRNMYLVNYCIRYYFKNIPIPQEDMQQLGLEGLVYAMNKFDYTRESSFETYARLAIKHNIQRRFKTLIGISWKVYQLKKNINSLKEKNLQNKKGNTFIDDKELEDGLLAGYSVNKIENAVRSLDYIYNICEIEPEIDDSHTTLGSMPISFGDYDYVDTVEDQISVLSEEKIETNVLNKEYITYLLSTLNEKERFVLQYRYAIADGIEHTLENIGKQFGMTYQWTHTTERKALVKLRNLIRFNKEHYIEEKNSSQNYKSFNLEQEYINSFYKLYILRNSIMNSDTKAYFLSTKNLTWKKEDVEQADFLLKEVLNQLEEGNTTSETIHYIKTIIYSKYKEHPISSYEKIVEMINKIRQGEQSKNQKIYQNGKK